MDIFDIALTYLALLSSKNHIKFLPGKEDVRDAS
jgi:hypothetical protein